MDQNQYWQAVLEKDRRFDGVFYLGVRSTGIYCRPSCPARKPLRQNVQFFRTLEEAEGAGFRPCKRCKPRDSSAWTPDPEQVALVEQVCRSIENRDGPPPSMQDLAESVHLSPSHLQRTFKRVVGITPRQYAAALRQKRLQHELRHEDTVTGALYAAGYGSSSSLYDQVSTRLGMTPSAYRQGGTAVSIRYTIVPCRLGCLLVAATGDGICAVSLGDEAARLAASLREEYPAAQIERADPEGDPVGDPPGGVNHASGEEDSLKEWVEIILRWLDGDIEARQAAARLPLDVQATAFQWRVWEALRRIPYGLTRTYAEVAREIGYPKAVRAVARACATNHVSLLIPCHRVVRSDGGLGGYRWGIERKQALLAAESNS
jgi:AraC family transcriptional regulator of adaptative response/methylated-DNA-[protein]-cysteine methyltransferase